MSNTTMYIFANRGAQMSSGKMAAQVAHAAVNAYKVSTPEAISEWELGGHYTKIVLLAKDENDLTTKQQYIEDRGYKTCMVIDEGRTEVDPFTKTALGVEIVDRDFPDVRATFGSFETYRDTIKVTLEIDK